MRNHGLINLILHPDYVLSDERLARYEAFLIFLRTRGDGGWFALPRDVAQWWRARAQLRCVEDESGVRLEGPEIAGATIAWARLEGDQVVIETERQS